MLKSLLHLLEHPQGVGVCEKLLDSSRPVNHPQAEGCGCATKYKEGGKGATLRSRVTSLCSTCFATQIATQGPPRCTRAHWGCVLQWMSAPCLQASGNGQIIELPEFCTLTPEVQRNFLVLLLKQVHRVPQSLLKAFVSSIKTSGATGVDPWLLFLLRKVELCISCDPEEVGDTNTLYTALSAESLSRVSALGESLQAGALMDSDHGSPQDGSGQMIKVVSLEQASSVKKQPCARDDLDRTRDRHFLKRSYEDGDGKEDRQTPALTESPPRKKAKMETEVLQSVDLERPHVDEVLMSAVRRIQDRWKSGQPSAPEDLEYLLSQSAENVRGALEHGGMGGLQEDGVNAVITSITTSQFDFSYQSTSVLLHTTVLPLLQGLDQCVSRSLISGLTSLVGHLPAVTANSLLLPLITGKSFGPAQTDAVTKLLKANVGEELWSHLWRELICSEKNDLQELFVWTENVVGVAQVLLNKHVPVDSEMADPLVRCLQRSAAHLKKSAKFAKFLIDVIKRHKAKLAPYSSSLSEIAGAHQSMMKSTLARTIKSMTK